MRVENSKELFCELEKAKRDTPKGGTRISKNAGLSRSAWHLIEKRGGNMNTDTLFSLCKELDVEIEVVKK